MANNFSFIEKTLPKQIDKVFAKESVTDILGRNNNFEFTDARTIKVFKLASTGLDDYNRGGHGNTNADGGAQSTLESFTCSQERYSAIPLDKLDSVDDGETVLGHLANEFIRVHVVREFDTYRLSKLAGYTNVTFGNRVVETISANTILGKLNSAFEWLTEQKVPEANQVIYVNPKVMNLIRSSSELVRYLSQSEYKNDVNFTIEKYMGRQIIEVPSDEFYTDCNLLTARNGSNKRGAIAKTSASKTINFLVVDKDAPIVAKRLDWAKVYTSEQQDLGYAGYKFANLYYHDLFIEDNKQVAVYCSVSEADAVANSLLIKAVAGSAQGKTKIEAVLPQPAGLIYDKIYTSSSAFTLGGTVGQETEVTLGADITPDASHNYFALAYNGVFVAVSKDFTTTLPKHA